VIYLDSSVALAHLLAEDRFPPADLWQQQLVSSRLLEYEVWNRIHARRLDQSHGDAVRALISRVALLELATPVLARALDPFPIAVRTLDALHLSSIEFLRLRQQQVKLASYDARLIAGARALHIPLYGTSRWDSKLTQQRESAFGHASCTDGITIQTWAKHQKDKPTRSEAIRRLIEIALTTKSKRQSSPGEK
jgi:predicted nucleic acid-binding protein